MSAFYLVITVKGNSNAILRPDLDLPVKIGYYSYVQQVTDQENLKTILDRLENAVFVNVEATKKAAEARANHRNACHKLNGEYLYGSGPFETGVNP